MNHTNVERKSLQQFFNLKFMNKMENEYLQER